MWLLLAICSACLLGLYDVAKKQSLKRNGVLNVLLFSTLFSTVLLFGTVTLFPGLAGAGSPHGSTADHLRLLFKAVLVTVSWISGLAGMGRLPITTASSIKASRPVFVILFSVLMFGERLSFLQWAGVLTALTGLAMLAGSSRKEGINFSRDLGVFYMAISVVAGVMSALFDKHIMQSLRMDPLFVQSWCNLYITILMGLAVAFKLLISHRSGKDDPALKFTWDWTLVVIAVLITIADAFYFFSLHCEDALLAVISIVRRCSVVVAFGVGAILFHERHLREKALCLAVLLAGIGLLAIGTVS